MPPLEYKPLHRSAIPEYPVEDVPECTGKPTGDGTSSKKDQIVDFIKTHWDVAQMVSEVEEEQRQLTMYYKRSCELREEQNKQAMMLLGELVQELDAHKNHKEEKVHMTDDVNAYKQKKQEDRELATDWIKDNEAETEQVLQNMAGCLSRLDPISSLETGRSPTYTSYPEVEVTIKVHYISNVDTANMKFEIDFVMMIDWVDEHLRDIAAKELRHLDWHETYFNPCVFLENAVNGVQGFADGRYDHEHPRYNELLPSGKPKPDDKDRIWLKKTQRFRSIMAMEDVDLSCFPYDMQVLPIVIKTLPLRLSAGRLRMPRLVHPTKRLEDTAYFNVARKADDYAMRHTGGGQFIGDKVDEQLTEFKLKGVRGVTDAESQQHKSSLTSKQCNGQTFRVQIFVERPMLSSYTWNLVITSVLVLLSATSFWDTASPDISSRLSISLTIILALAAYTSNRAAPIEKTPSLTFQDEYELMCLIFVIIVSLMNIVSVVICGGDNEKAPDFMQARFNSNEDLCMEGVCSSRKIDCHFMFAFGLITVVTAAYKINRLRHLRQESTQEIRELTNALVAERKKRSIVALSQKIASFGVGGLTAAADGAQQAVDKVVEGMEDIGTAVRAKSRRMSKEASDCRIS